MPYWKKIMPKPVNHSLPGVVYALTLVIGSCFCCLAQAAVNLASLNQTQIKLKQLDSKIDSLQQHLTSVHDKRGLLNNKLAETEKQIGEGIRKLRSIQLDLNSKEQKIAALQNTMNQLNKQLYNQQQLLAKHIRTRYQMGEYQPLKWLLNQDNPYKINKILTYYQYIIKSRQQLIDEIDATGKEITANKDKLRLELAQTRSLQKQLNLHQQDLEQRKKYHTTLIQSLNSEIATKKQTLNDFKKDKLNLSRLLKSLSQQSVIAASKPFAQMRKKLPPPIQAAQRSLRKMNQGVTFFADEGTAVTAVYPGKVVFSDWLKGYGLLLIIDHGQGFMTLYAHNQSLFKRKGQQVNQSEQIASVGHSGGIKQNGLYFEIRLRGKAVSPLQWLS